MKNQSPNDWNFKNIANDFDNHVREQLPWYDLIIDTIAFISRNYVPINGTIYDIGCSTNNIKKILAPTILERNINYISIDNTPEMKPDICNNAQDVDYNNFDVAILNLTLMFIHPKYRHILINKLLHKLEIGGAIIIVDKFILNEHYLSTILKRLTIHWKYFNTNPKNIVEKELSLSGIQIPLYTNDLIFDNISTTKFFQLGEFSGYILTKNKL